MTAERRSAVTLGGNPLTLVGPELKAGDSAPDFRCVKGLNEPVSIDTYRDKVKVFNVIGSVDTSVCDNQTRKFNEEASDLPDKVVVITVSMDLPFAMNRYCAAAGIDKVEMISDYQHASFGESYGVLVKEYRLLSRSLFIADTDNVLRYVQYVKEISEEPDYESALSVLRSMI